MHIRLWLSVIVIFLGVTFSLWTHENLTWTHNCAIYNLRFFFVRVSDVDLLVNSIMNVSFGIPQVSFV